MRDENCIFCKLANGDIPTNIIYEDDMFAVILDASPATKGHALILPKEHAANIYELSEETASRIFVLAKKMAAKMTELLESGFTDTFRYFYPDVTDRYSWWSYMFKAREKNAGWRIDYFLTSKSLDDRLVSADIRHDVLGSDHCPVELQADLD